MRNPCNITEYLLHIPRPLEGDGAGNLIGEVSKALKLFEHTVAVEARVLRDSHLSRIVSQNMLVATHGELNNTAVIIRMINSGWPRWVDKPGRSLLL